MTDGNPLGVDEERTKAGAVALPVLDPVTALRAACLLVGLLGLIAVVFAISSPVTGATAVLIGTVMVLYGLHGSPTWEQRRHWPHIVAAILSAINLFGLCASQCGAYKAYEDILGIIPTAVVGMVSHTIVAVVTVLRRTRPNLEFAADAMTMVCIGGSLFYAALLTSTMSWCGACFAIHGLMLVQGVEMVHARRGSWSRLAVISTIIGSAGVLNASYHHRLVQIERDDMGELTAYLRSAWTSTTPPRPVVQESGEMRENRLAIKKNRQSTSQPAPSAVATPVSGNAFHASDMPLRNVSAAGVWGDPGAPVTLLVAMDPMCPHCAAQMPELLSLQDLVEGNRLAVRFLLTYDKRVAQAMASLVYANGFRGGGELVRTLGVMYQNQARMAVPADAVAVIPEGEQSVVVDLVRNKQQDITSLLIDAKRLKDALGGVGEPVLWLKRASSQKPERRFDGTTMAPALRLAVMSLLQP